MKENPVQCPHCKGSGKNPEPDLQDKACAVCDGHGTIAKRHADALADVRRDIGNRLLAMHGLAT